jgi:hypothetical protein
MSRPDEVDPDFAALVDEVFSDYAAAMAADAPLGATWREAAVVLRAAARHGVAVPAVEEDLLGGTLDRDARRLRGALMRAVRNAHQVHGAIGTTREHVLHRVTVPILAWTNDFGSVAEWDALIEQTARDAGDAGLWELVTGTSAATGAPS